MNVKLTLSMEQAVIERAKKYAREKGSSLSDIVENYLRILVQEDGDAVMDPTPVTNSLKGSFKAPKDYNYREQLSAVLAKKYLKNE
jgi:hypothetical protein